MRTLQTYKQLLIIAVLALFLAPCYLPIPEPKCSDRVEIVTGPSDTAYTIDRACGYFAERMHVDSIIVTKSMANTTIEFHRWAPPCRGIACAKFYPDGRAELHIQSGRRDWPILVAHEVYHVLLYRIFANNPINQHHEIMFKTGLCRPKQAVCGY